MPTAAKVITLRISPEEHALLKSASHRSETSLNQYVRKRCGLPPEATHVIETTRLYEETHPTLPPIESPYGYCPKCGERGASRERRPNGQDTCDNRHVYPSASALHVPPAAASDREDDG